MIRKEKKASKKIWILSVFTVFIAIAMSFVSWLIYAVFSQSYREIKQQYYGVVSRQIVEDIENSIRNGKQIERFYGMDKVLGDMLGLISTEQVPINTAITDINGSVLYNSYSDSDRKEEYNALLLNENVMYNISFDGEGSSAFRIADAGEYEVMIQPIYDREGSQIGAMTLFYRLADIEQELLPQKQRSDMVTMACIGATILLLVIYFVVLPRSICEVGKNSAPDSVEELRRKQHENKFLFVIPVLAIMVGLLVQCVIAYNEYQKRYKDVMFEGAVGISSYIGEIINDLYEKGVDYDRMNGLPEYLAVKVEDSPLLWNVSVVNVYADTSDILTRSSEYNVSLKISGDDSLNTFINVEISKEYIDEKMLGMLLVFAVTFAVALIMIFELLKLPDAMFTRISRNFRQSETVQAGRVHCLHGNVRRDSVFKRSDNPVEQIRSGTPGNFPGVDTHDGGAAGNDALFAVPAPGLPANGPEAAVLGFCGDIGAGKRAVLLLRLAGIPHTAAFHVRYRICRYQVLTQQYRVPWLPHSGEHHQQPCGAQCRTSRRDNLRRHPGRGYCQLGKRAHIVPHRRSIHLHIRRCGA